MPTPKPSIGAPAASNCGDPVFVEVAAGEHGDVVEPGVVEQAAHRPRMHCQVTAVEAHAADRDAFGRQPCRQADYLGDGRLGVVGVDQQRRPVGPGARKGLEGSEFARMRLDEGVRHRAEHRQAVAAAGLCGGRPGKAGDVCGAGGEQGRLGAVRAPHAEVHQPPAGRGDHDPRRLRRDQRLEVHDVEQAAFDELRLRAAVP